MSIKDEKFLKERSLLDVDTGLVLKVVLASAVVASAIFYVGLTLGKGELVKQAEGSVAPDMRALYQRVRQVKARVGDAESDKYFVFPSILKRSAADGTEDDEVFNSLKKLLPASMKAHQREMQAFEEEAAMKTLLARHELTQEDLDRARIPEDKKAELREKLAALMKRMAAKGEPYPRVAPAPKELLEEPAPLAEDQPVLAAAPAEQLFAPPPMDDSAQMVMIAPDEPEVVQPPKGNAKVKLGRFTLQLQAFQSRAEAEKFQAVMRAEGYGTFVEKADLKDKGTWYRVRLGRFAEKDAAQEYKNRFERSQGFVTQIMTLGE